MRKKSKPTTPKPNPKIAKGESKPLVYGPRVNPTERKSSTPKPHQG